MEKMQDQGSKAMKTLSEKLGVNVKATKKVANNIDDLSNKSNLIGEIINKSNYFRTNKSSSIKCCY